jgi:hypothetical protein
MFLALPGCISIAEEPINFLDGRVGYIVLSMDTLTDAEAQKAL